MVTGIDRRAMSAVEGRTIRNIINTIRYEKELKIVRTRTK